MASEVLLLRHGETDWSRVQRHTGRTDIPLNALGEARARALRPVLAGLPGLDTATVATSPLDRARRTAELAGIGDRAQVWPELTEWEYGAAEGRTTAEIRDERPGWSVWTDPLPGAESADDVGARADVVIERVEALAGLVVLVAHAHFLRILGARWCGFPAAGGQHLTLDTASTSMLGYEREARVILRWNALPEAVERAASLVRTPPTAPTQV